MYNVPARFTDLRAKAEVQLSTGQIENVYTALEADGVYSNWWEYPADPCYGKEQFIEQEVDEDNATPLYSDEFEYVDTNKTIEPDEDIKIVKVLKVLDADWEVDEDSLDNEYTE